MYKITKEYFDDSAVRLYQPDGTTEWVPITRTVRETYCNQGVYVLHGSGLRFGEEDGHSFWTLDPKMGRMEYKFDGTCLYITKYIKVPVKFDNNIYWCWPETSNCIGFDSLEDLIMYYYISTEFTRTKDVDMTYAFGCRKYGDYLEKLS